MSNAPRFSGELLALALMALLGAPLAHASTPAKAGRGHAATEAFEPSPLALRRSEGRPGSAGSDGAYSTLSPAPAPGRALDWPSPRVERGIQIGAAIGAGAGVLATVIATRGDDGIGDLFEPLLWAVGGLAGAAAGGVLGGVIAAVTGD